MTIFIIRNKNDCCRNQGQKFAGRRNQGQKIAGCRNQGHIFFRGFLISSCDGSRVTKCQFSHHEPLDSGRFGDALQNCLIHLLFYLLAKLVKNAFFSSELHFHIYLAGVSILGTKIMLGDDIGDMSPNNDRESPRSQTADFSVKISEQIDELYTSRKRRIRRLCKRKKFFFRM